MNVKLLKLQLIQAFFLIHYQNISIRLAHKVNKTFFYI